MNDLPAGLAEGLHILKPEPSGWGPFIAGAAALALFAWWLYSRRRPSPSASPPAAPGPVDGSLEHAVAAIRDRARKTRRYRRGCHELAVCLRRALSSEDAALERLTAREIFHRLGEDGRTRVLTLISESRFGKRPPGAADLDALCELALAVFASPERGR